MPAVLAVPVVLVAAVRRASQALQKSNSLSGFVASLRFSWLGY
jgi:hypothetical protein